MSEYLCSHGFVGFRKKALGNKSLAGIHQRVNAVEGFYLRDAKPEGEINIQLCGFVENINPHVWSNDTKYCARINN